MTTSDIATIGRSPARRRATGVLLAVGLFLGLAVAVAPAASAHSEIVSSNPEMGATLKAPPQEIEMVFDHVIDTKFPAVAITIGEDVPVDLTVRVDDRKVYATVGDVPELVVDGPIVWKVGYRMLAVDGTPLGGTLMFFVDDGIAGAAPAGSEIVAGATDATAPSAPASESGTPSAAVASAAPTVVPVAAEPAEEGSGPGSLIWILLVVAVLAAVAGALWARNRRSAATPAKAAGPASGRPGGPKPSGGSGARTAGRSGGSGSAGRQRPDRGTAR